ncbi:hypothetical protein JCM10207_001818 [Rhodosporidiobolus poonsookiae]
MSSHQNRPSTPDQRVDALFGDVNDTVDRLRNLSLADQWTDPETLRTQESSNATAGPSGVEHDAPPPSRQDNPSTETSSKASLLSALFAKLHAAGIGDAEIAAAMRGNAGSAGSHSTQPLEAPSSSGDRSLPAQQGGDPDSPLHGYSNKGKGVRYETHERGRSMQRSPSPRFGAKSLPRPVTPENDRRRSRSFSPIRGTIIQARELEKRRKHAARVALDDLLKEEESAQRVHARPSAPAGVTMSTAFQQPHAELAGGAQKPQEGANRSSTRAPESEGSHYKKPKPPAPGKYSGQTRLIDAEKWKRGLRIYFVQSDILEESLAAFPFIKSFLEGDALRWIEGQPSQDVEDAWMSLPRNADANKVTSPWPLSKIYEEIKIRFIDPTSHVAAEAELEALRQGSMRVQQYAQRILDLSDLVPESTAYRRKRKLIDHMDPDIGTLVFRKYPRFDIDETIRFEDLLRAALDAEREVLALRRVAHARSSNDDFPGLYGLLSATHAPRTNRNNRSRSNRNNSDRSTGPAVSSPTPAPAGAGSGRRRGNNKSERARSASAQRVRDERAKNKQCFYCGEAGHIAGACPAKGSPAEKKGSKLSMMTTTTTEEKEDNGPFPRLFVIKVGLKDEDGFEAAVDTGASDSAMKYSVANALNLQVKKYKKPIRVQLGTKGSRAMAHSYVECRFRCAGVDRQWKFMLLPIEEEVIIGRDFLRAHEASLRFNPDRLVCDAPQGRPHPHRRAPKKLYAAKRAFKKLQREEDAPPVPRELEMPVFVSKITDPAKEADEDYEPSAEEKDEFLSWLLEFFTAKGTVQSKTDPLPLPPHRGPDLDHSVEYIAGAPDLDPAIAYPWSRVHTPAMLRMIDIYKKGGQFEHTTKPATSALFPVLKKDGNARPVSDLRERNKRTVSQKMQPVDARAMVNNVAAARFKMGNDLLRAFEQVRADEDAESKNIVASPVGNYVIKTAMQGDKNSPTSLQKNMLVVLEGQSKRCVEHYADDLWVFGNWWRQFKIDTIEMYTRLYRYYYVISLESIQYCPDEYKILGRIVVGHAIKMDPKQVDALINYVQPTTPTGLQRFNGAVNWQSTFVPRLQLVLAPLQQLAASKAARLTWKKDHLMAFEEIKRLLQEAKELASFTDDQLAPASSRPAHLDHFPKEGEVVPQNKEKGKYLFVQTDASGIGCGGTLSVGENWWSAQVVEYYSKKHTSSQMNYSAYKAELLAVVLAVVHWMDILQGRTVIFISDNKALVQLAKQKRLNKWQLNAWEVLSSLDYEFEWIQGIDNKTADALSRQYLDGNPVLEEPEGEWDFPQAVFKMMNRPQRTRRAPVPYSPDAPVRRTATHAAAVASSGEEEGEEAYLNLPNLEPVHVAPSPSLAAQPALSQLPTRGTSRSSRRRRSKKAMLHKYNPGKVSSARNEETRTHLVGAQENARKVATERKKQRHTELVLERRKAEAWEKPSDEEVRLDESWLPRLYSRIAELYSHDSHFGKVIADISAHAEFSQDAKGLLWRTDSTFGEQLCLPYGSHSGRSIREIYLEHFHTLTGHAGVSGTVHALRAQVWWPSLVKDTTAYISSCPACQATKHETTHPRGRLHSIVPPKDGYAKLSIDFMGPFPPSLDWEGNSRDFIFSLMDVATGRIKLLACNKTITAEGAAALFLDRVYPDWGMPDEIISDRDPRWTSDFWRAFFAGIGSTLSMSTAYHPATNGKVERAHRTSNAKLRNLVQETQKDFARLLPHVEIAFNACKNVSGFSPFELTEVFQPQLLSSERRRTGSKRADELLSEAQLRNEAARDMLGAARIEQTHFANRHRRTAHTPGLTAEEAQADTDAVTHYWVRTSNWRTVPERSRAWVPPFCGPFPCLSFDHSNDTYLLGLPERYTARGILCKFHASQVKPFIPNDEDQFPNRLVDSVPLFPLDALDEEADYVPFPRSTAIDNDMAAPLFSPADCQGVWHHKVEDGQLLLGYTTLAGQHRWIAAGTWGFDDSVRQVQDYLVKFAGRASSSHPPAEVHRPAPLYRSQSQPRRPPQPATTPNRPHLPRPQQAGPQVRFRDRFPTTPPRRPASMPGAAASESAPAPPSRPPFPAQSSGWTRTTAPRPFMGPPRSAPQFSAPKRQPPPPSRLSRPWSPPLPTDRSLHQAQQQPPPPQAPQAQRMTPPTPSSTAQPRLRPATSLELRQLQEAIAQMERDGLLRPTTPQPPQERIVPEMGQQQGRQATMEAAPDLRPPRAASAPTAPRATTRRAARCSTRTETNTTASNAAATARTRDAAAAVENGTRRSARLAVPATATTTVTGRPARTARRPQPAR